MKISCFTHLGQLWLEVFSSWSTLTDAARRSDLLLLSKYSCLALVRSRWRSCRDVKAVSMHSRFFFKVFPDSWNLLRTSTGHLSFISWLTFSISSFKYSVFLIVHATLIAPWISPGLNVFRALLLQSSSALVLQNSLYIFYIACYLPLRDPLRCFGKLSFLTNKLIFWDATHEN